MEIRHSLFDCAKSELEYAKLIVSGIKGNPDICCQMKKQILHGEKLIEMVRSDCH